MPKKPPEKVIVRTDNHAEDEDQKVGRKAIQADGYWKVPPQPRLRTAHFDEEELETQTPPGQGRRREGQRNEPLEGFPAVRSVIAAQLGRGKAEVHSSKLFTFTTRPVSPLTLLAGRGETERCQEAL